MEAIRVRAIANGDTIGDFPIDDNELGFAVAAVETGTLNRPASILIQAGFHSRLAAIKAVNDTGATFQTGQELRQWLNSEAILGWSALPNWPTMETRAMWIEFSRSFSPNENLVWADRRYWVGVEWFSPPPTSGTSVQIYEWAGHPHVFSTDGKPLGFVQAGLNPGRTGLLHAEVAPDGDRVDIKYIGPNDLATG